jgi:hypothetical protein
VLKVAVAFFGIPRNSAICFPSIQKHVLAQIPQGTDVRCFYHLYKVDTVLNRRSGEDGSLVASNYDPFMAMTGSLEQDTGVLERWDFERIKALGDTWGDEHASVRNLLLQLHSLHTVTGMVETFEPDFVIFVRPDIKYHTSFPSYVFDHPAPRRLNAYIPNWQWWGGLNDRFAICGRDVYHAYGRRIERIFEFSSATGRKLHSERLLKFSLQQAEAKICLLATTGSRVRINGDYAEEDFTGTHGMGKRENRYLHPIAYWRTWFDARRR